MNLCGLGKRAVYSSDMDFQGCEDDPNMPYSTAYSSEPSVIGVVNSGSATEILTDGPETTIVTVDREAIGDPVFTDGDVTAAKYPKTTPVADEAMGRALAVATGEYVTKTIKCPCTKNITEYVNTPYHVITKRPKQVHSTKTVRRQVPEQFTAYRNVRRYRNVTKKVPVTVYKTVIERQPYTQRVAVPQVRLRTQLHQIPTTNTVLENVRETRYRKTPVTKTVRTMRNCTYREPVYKPQCQACEE